MSDLIAGEAAEVPTASAPPSRVIYEEMRRQCRETCGDRVRSIIVTGSLARDEGTMILDGDSWTVVGDVEFLLIFHDAAPMPADAAEAALAAQVEVGLAKRGIACHIDVSAGSTDYLRRLAPSIFAYELRHCGRVIAGDGEILSLIPAFSADEIPFDDAWRLLTNRLVEQLEIVASEPSGALPSGLAYRLVKLHLDMATSFLVFAGAYAPTYRARAERLDALSATVSAAPVSLAEFAGRVRACTRWKIAPAGATDVPPDLGRWQDAIRDARRLWRWELVRLTGVAREMSDEALLRHWMARQPLRDRVRGWLHVLRHCGWHKSAHRWPHWMRSAWHGSPRYWVYLAATALLFELAEGSRDGEPRQLAATLARLRRVLPVVPGSIRASRSETASLAGQIAWNYSAFLVRSRA